MAVSTASCTVGRLAPSPLAASTAPATSPSASESSPVGSACSDEDLRTTGSGSWGLTWPAAGLSPELAPCLCVAAATAARRQWSGSVVQEEPAPPQRRRQGLAMHPRGCGVGVGGGARHSCTRRCVRGWLAGGVGEGGAVCEGGGVGRGYLCGRGRRRVGGAPVRRRRRRRTMGDGSCIVLLWGVGGGTVWSRLVCAWLRVAPRRLYRPVASCSVL